MKNSRRSGNQKLTESVAPWILMPGNRLRTFSPPLEKNNILDEPKTPCGCALQRLEIVELNVAFWIAWTHSFGWPVFQRFCALQWENSWPYASTMANCTLIHWNESRGMAFWSRRWTKPDKGQRRAYTILNLILNYLKAPKQSVEAKKEENGEHAKRCNNQCPKAKEYGQSLLEPFSKLFMAWIAGIKITWICRHSVCQFWDKQNI